MYDDEKQMPNSPEDAEFIHVLEISVTVADFHLSRA